MFAASSIGPGREHGRAGIALCCARRRKHGSGAGSPPNRGKRQGGLSDARAMCGCLPDLWRDGSGERILISACPFHRNATKIGREIRVLALRRSNRSGRG